MTRKIILTVLALFVLTGALVGVKALQFKTMFAQAEQMAPPPAVVSTAEVRQDSWRPFLHAIGSVTAVQGVILSAEVPGTVARLTVDSGATVEAGTVLIEIDSSTEQAELESAEARLALAEANLRRSNDLRANNTIAQSELDAAEATAKQAEAETARLRAVIAKKTIRAPFAGQLGIRQVNLGQYLSSGTAIISLQALDPVYVDFTLPQQRLSHLEVGLPVEITSDSFPEERFDGSITAISPEVDVATRNVRVRASLENPERRLRPGMFTNVSIFLREIRDVVAIPATSVIHAPYGNSVFVVEEDGEGVQVVRQKFVRLGESRGDFVAVEEGLSAGQTVVVTGGFKLRNGVPVTVNNDLAPEVTTDPTPAES